VKTIRDLWAYNSVVYPVYRDMIQSKFLWSLLENTVLSFYTTSRR